MTPSVTCVHCAPVTWVTEYVTDVHDATKRSSCSFTKLAQVFKMQINLIDCDILSGFELTLSGDNPKGVASQG